MPPMAPTTMPAMTAVESPLLACPPWLSPVCVAVDVVAVAVPVPVLEPVVASVVVADALVELVWLVESVLLDVWVEVDFVEVVVVDVAAFAAAMKSSSSMEMGVAEVVHAPAIVE